MPNIVRNFINSLKLNEDDYEDYIDDFEEEEELEPKKVKPTALPSRQKEALAPKFADRERPVKREEVPEAKKERPSSRMERTTNNKIVPIRTTSRGFEVCIMRPSSFEDSQDICDMLLTGRAAVVNLEGFDSDEAQRIMDFISGCVYAINGKLHQISKYIFIFSPDTVDISGDYLDLADIGFGVPNLNKEF
ncbi:cell division protein SepF [Acetivibrio ethanolgignens]|uniref:Cell division protein SepF n=1 Tax=Acetivibrio ethanolgignens TaxID=290052 RepID=A0A0V8QH73_9FIRM|nr:cell division protein SepF [Acetivibrio ethanolgignens]KSV59931.1 hypothetical protein ASU35_07265 [Acetivibrio ethanolgignens]